MQANSPIIRRALQVESKRVPTPLEAGGVHPSLENQISPPFQGHDSFEKGPVLPVSRLTPPN